jgi:NADH:ubiquinone oxidoreductase subunit 2 (subunit N)
MCSAAGALKNCSRDSVENQAAVVAAGGIPPLVGFIPLFFCRDCVLEVGMRLIVQRSAAGALKNCSWDSVENQAAVVAAGGIPPLVGLMAFMD